MDPVANLHQINLIYLFRPNMTVDRLKLYSVLIIPSVYENKVKKCSVLITFTVGLMLPCRLGFMETGRMKPGFAPACDSRRADFNSEWEVKNEEQPLTATETTALFRTLFNLIHEFFQNSFPFLKAKQNHPIWLHWPFTTTAVGSSAVCNAKIVMFCNSPLQEC